MMPKADAALLPLPDACTPQRPLGALGELYLRPAAAPFTPLQKWPRAQRLAELARVDQALAALDRGRAADTPPAAGPLLPVGAPGRNVAKKSLEKYRRRLVRALGPRRRGDAR